MKIECMQLAEQKHAKWICMIIQWLMQMQCMNMINDKCMNDMSIMMPWRDAWCDQGTSQSEFGPHTNSDEVYEVAAKPVVKAAMEGVNGMKSGFKAL